MSAWRRLLRLGRGVRDPAPEERPDWTPGGPAAFVHYDVPGDYGGRVLRTAARPPGDVVVQLLRRGEHDAWLDHLLEGAPGAELVRADPALAERVRAAPSCLQVRGSVPDPRDLSHLRAVERLVDAALDAGGVAVRDEVALRGFLPERWRSEVSGGQSDVVARHVAILATPGAEGVHLRTRGAAKLGRPDLDAGTVAEREAQEVLAVLNDLLARQARGERLPERGALPTGRSVAGPVSASGRLSVESIRHEDGVLHLRVTRVT